MARRLQRPIKADDPQQFVNTSADTRTPRGPGTRYTRWTKTRDGSGDPEIRMARTGSMRERSGKVNKV